eukprot:TRINITY_DN4319_c0_g1_i1.p1 TRINITY_DN4319_c0_g1~~TRINITY_DN4319_c0_g1_i1.p1  ORF type:complete len:271 (+),score=35.82 TRINITY_DN4319_c0_g1_i1:73-885(+)
MACTFSFNSLLFLFLHLNSIASKYAFCELVLEYGYTVSTVLNGDKVGNPINPYAILPRPQDVLVLDSANSALYTLSLPISQDSKINRFSGNGFAGFSDGDSTASAMFNHPRSFAMDAKGNVYVADRNNHAIRKVSRSGVTTIAGGYSNKTGNTDGPAQNASFSNDFDLVFVPKLCALLISDRGNRLIRQINLEPAVCAQESQSGLGMGSVSLIGVVCLLLGLVAGFAARPFVTYTGIFRRPQHQQDMEALPNPSGQTSTDTLLRHQKRNC